MLLEALTKLFVVKVPGIYGTFWNHAWLGYARLHQRLQSEEEQQDIKEYQKHFCYRALKS